MTPAAIYRHFAGRDDLIAETARQGYLLLADMLSEAQAILSRALDTYLSGLAAPAAQIRR